MPTVISTMSAMNIDIGSEANCVGTSAQVFGDCIMSVHKDKDQWTRLRRGGLDFIARTHNRRHLSQVWNDTVHRGTEMLASGNM